MTPQQQQQIELAMTKLEGLGRGMAQLMGAMHELMQTAERTIQELRKVVDGAQSGQA